MKNTAFTFIFLINSTFLSSTSIEDKCELKVPYNVNAAADLDTNEIGIESDSDDLWGIESTIGNSDFFSTDRNYTLVQSTKNKSVKILTFNVISEMNGVGLEVDQKIMANALQSLGHRIQCIDIGKKQIPPKADINIFFQRFRPEWLLTAHQNWLIPNPEWYMQGAKDLDDIDLILCRTKEVKRIFSKYSENIYYLGFTSIDCYKHNLGKDFHTILHLAGQSAQKGTTSIVDVWRSNPQFPLLNVIQKVNSVQINQSNYYLIPNRVDLETLRTYQNTCGIHLCPSETEGFGHYLVEAMSSGAVVVTTNAPPMNEFITDPRCLVNYNKTQNQRFGINYYVDPKDLEKVINNLLKMTNEELRFIGQNNRKAFLQNQKMFHKRLKLLLQSDLVDKKKTTPITN
ncbi:MAG: glycosyltransferase [Parachlamydiaceae bacterium]|nr:glycosyltransferase [Parachlamydiaceae bacterium]